MCLSRKNPRFSWSVSGFRWRNTTHHAIGHLLNRAAPPHVQPNQPDLLCKLFQKRLFFLILQDACGLVLRGTLWLILFVLSVCTEFTSTTCCTTCLSKLHTLAVLWSRSSIPITWPWAVCRSIAGVKKKFIARFTGSLVTRRLVFTNLSAAVNSDRQCRYVCQT